jgi:adenylate cyclase
VSEVVLHETEAAVVLFDVVGFSQLAADLAPLEIGLALSRFYALAEQCILGSGGRLVKFVGDAVLGAWVAKETPWPNSQAVSAIVAAEKERPAFRERCVREGIGELAYTATVTFGPVLAGQIGTERHKAWDILGDPVNLAFKLTSVAQARGLGHLIAAPVPDFPLVEVEGIEIGKKMIRLFRLGEATA